MVILYLNNMYLRNTKALSVPLSINQTRSIDFMSDSLNTGRKIRAFNVIDDYNRECLGTEADHFLPAQRVIQSLATQ
jgi:putative transposase